MLRSIFLLAFIACVCSSERISEKKCKVYEENTFSLVDTSLLPFQKTLIRSYKCSEGTGLIVGGSDAEEGEFPYFALLGYFNGNKTKWWCGGSLISENFVLTAGHCVTKNSQSINKVRLGEHNLNEANSDRQDYGILQKIKHKEYKNRPVIVNDIALIKLAESVTFTNKIYPLCLNHDPQNFVDKLVTTTGFGFTSHAGSSSNILQKVRLQIKSNDSCAKLNIIDSQICIRGNKTANNEFKDTCQGDSGGGVVTIKDDNKCMFVLHGITSHGIACGFNLPAVYTRVSSYIDWIESNVWPNES